ncbi:potassium channel family protein [Dehalogenimonas sp. THU2]|uniref:potassium channel family protein n=1 Tax=Dehalogenimonas sp. THU2 TaxID=3151121 RepID=UPI003218870D
MTTLKRLSLALTILLSVVALGTIGFVTIEGMSPFDAFYLTVLTITTVGYGDIVPITSIGRLLAMALVVTGFTFFTAVVVTSVQVVFERREEKRRTQQLSTLTTLFFSEIGDKLIKFITPCDLNIDQIRTAMTSAQSWTDADFTHLIKTLRHHPLEIDPRLLDIEAVRTLLSTHLLLTFLENPHIFDHVLFNGLLRATFHLRDELTAHRDFSQIPKAKLDHISNDIKKVYQPAIKLWLEHMVYMKKSYPVLFSTILDSNPFMPETLN